MMNPFTVGSRIKEIQQDVLRPLYVMYPGQEDADYDRLLAETGRVIGSHQGFIEEMSRSSLLAFIFKIIKLFGGADQLSEEDFNRFTSYVNDGGLTAMVTMLLSEDREQTFVDELAKLDIAIRRNAAPMLAKSRDLHRDFITGFFQETYGSLQNTPQKLRDNFARSDAFIHNLSLLAGKC